jgi:hypothetical protein
MSGRGFVSWGGEDAAQAASPAYRNHVIEADLGTKGIGAWLA